MVSYKLTYFNLRGIAEPIRFMFKYTKTPFEDIQIDCATWPTEKQNFKWQQLPYLEYKGKILTQSLAISRFLARKFDLSPEDPWEDAKCEEIVGAINDLRLLIKPYVLAKMQQKGGDAKVLKQDILSSSLPRYLLNFNDILAELRNSYRNGDFIFGSRPVWADFWLAHFTDQWSLVFGDENLLTKYNLLNSQKNAVYNIPAIAEWISLRPQAAI